MREWNTLNLSCHKSHQMDVEDLLMYFDRTYVSGCFRQIQQTDPDIRSSCTVFHQCSPHTCWSCTMPPWTPHTNNFCEGWNNMFFNLVRYHHPRSWPVIEWFQQERATVSTVIHQDAVGSLPRPHVRGRSLYSRKSACTTFFFLWLYF